MEAKRGINKVFRFEDGQMSYKSRIDLGIITKVEFKDGKFLAHESDGGYRTVGKYVFDYFNKEVRK